MPMVPIPGRKSIAAALEQQANGREYGAPKKRAAHHDEGKGPAGVPSIADLWFLDGNIHARNLAEAAQKDAVARMCTYGTSIRNRHSKVPFPTVPAVTHRQRRLCNPGMQRSPVAQYSKSFRDAQNFFEKFAPYS